MSNAATLNNPERRAASRASLRDLLRQATGQAHADLDRCLGLLDLTALPGYRRFLEISASALLPLEDVLVTSGVQRIFPDWGMRSRRHAIMNDLDGLGGVARPLEIQSPLDLGGVLGTMYVLEGSRLGGRVLLSSVVRSTDPAVAGTTNYLSHGMGQRLWPSFVETLEALGGTSECQQDAALNGACRAFALFACAAGSGASNRAGSAKS